MKIALVAPIWYALPPAGYSAIERIVSYLTDTLVDLGHDVTLYASGDSHSTARLRPLCPVAMSACSDPLERSRSYLDLHGRLLDEASEFDVVCFYNDFLDNIPAMMPIDRRMFTMPLGWGEASKLERIKPHAYTKAISITDVQRGVAPWLNWVATIHLGLPETLYQPSRRHEDYLVCLARFNPSKRLDRAIRIAQLAGKKLKIIGPWDGAGVDPGYRDRLVGPLVRSDQIELLGEMNDEEKGQVLGKASALLFTGDGPETFGIAMIEAMACGTPAIGWNRWSMPEVISDGISGFVIDSIVEGVDAVKRIDRLDRGRVRKEFELRYTAERMAQDHLRLFNRLS